MRKFIININGNSYEVEVEEVKGDTKSAEKPVAEPVVKPVQESKPLLAAEKIVKAPMPGNIWKIVSQVGQEVKAGDVLLILEAMKMENEILAAEDGVVSSILVEEGATVAAGEDLLILN